MSSSSSVVVVRRPRSSWSTFPPALGIGALHQLDQHRHDPLERVLTPGNLGLSPEPASDEHVQDRRAEGHLASMAWMREETGDGGGFAAGGVPAAARGHERTTTGVNDNDNDGEDDDEDNDNDSRSRCATAAAARAESHKSCIRWYLRAN